MLQRRLLVLSVASSALSVSLLVAYRLTTGSGLDFLVWNLALAWVPLVAALALDDVRSTPLVLQLPLLAVWLVFFPNAPYLVTDLVHIDPHGHDTLSSVLGSLTLVAAAPAGLALGFSSLVLVERTLRERFGPRVALAASVASLAAASVGVYLGRIVRLNSWDLLTRPRFVAASLHERLVDPLAHLDALAGTAVLAAALAACYLAFRRTTRLER